MEKIYIMEKQLQTKKLPPKLQRYVLYSSSYY